MIEAFLKNNWRTVILIGVVLFAWFVWPTPYFYWAKKDHRYRANRFTGAEESRWGGLGQWRKTDWESFQKAKQDDADLKKKLGIEDESKK